MRRLLSILTDSFLIWSRNLTLTYALMFLPLILSVVIPETGTPALQTRWLVLFGVILLLAAAFMAGWFNLVGLACTRFVSKPREQALATNNPLEGFTLLQAFFPGVSGNLIPMVVGLAVQALAIGALIWKVSPLLPQYQTLMDKAMPAGDAGQLAPLSAVDVTRLLTPAELSRFMEITAVLYGALLVYLLFWFLTMLWPAFVTLYGDNPFRAYLRSVTQFVRDPLRMLALCGLYIAFQIFLFIVTVLVLFLNPVIALVANQLAGMMFLSYFAVLLFMYCAETFGKPTHVDLSEAPDILPESDE